MKELQNKIEQFYSSESNISVFDIEPIMHELVSNLNNGKIRSAEPFNGSWKVNEWVKKGILLLFRFGKLSNMSNEGIFSFFDKDTLPVHTFGLEDSVRIVPGGSSIRTGCYVAKGVICMPPMYINIGAYVDEGTMIDSHALVGTCAQIGKRVHLSAASQIGGVLEPPGAMPVIVEDDVMIGGNCGVYEGVLIRKRAVLGSGVILNSSTRVYDIVNEKILKADKGIQLEIPESAVVIPGSRHIDTEFSRANGLSVSTAIIVKYRDEKTDARTALEQALR
ncbi:MAG: 2,3,4,5-tetrahydropyridine-2,6-dicarboxylate N-succinyltransferase [Bacteroidetes bacterium]|nr:2,3,4,5-tetrahydropyridine-2,6-dicarboxylate N-succinyltransferase [Bacteroidota bacterium]